MSCFIAYATYAENTPVGIDEGFTQDYIAVLRKFSLLATTNSTSASTAAPGEKVDLETQSRMRMIGLAGLHAAASSDSVFATSRPNQVDAIIPALLFNIFQVPIEELTAKSAQIPVDATPSPFFSEFSARRPNANHRRAPSLHAHIPGEKGPTSSDVLAATLQSLDALVRQCTVDQASQVIDSILLYFDRSGISDVPRSSWLADRLTALIQLQYRFVVPTHLIEILADIDTKDLEPSAKQVVVLSMATTVLSSSVPLNGLGVVDLVNNLVALIIRRIHISQTDALIPPLVQCITSLGTHIYYADQINDIVEELALRMGEVSTSDPDRPEVIRVLIHAIIGVLDTAIAADVAEARANAQQEANIVNKGKAPAVDTPTEHPAWSSGRRNPVAIQVWQETLPLLCEATFAVRSAYARALVLFLQKEMPKESRTKISEQGMYRFCHALNAAVYTLALSSTLGSDSPASSVNASATNTAANSEVIARDTASDAAATPKKPERLEKLERSDKAENKSSEKGVSFNITEPSLSDGPTDGVETPPRQPQSRRGSRRPSLPLNRLNSSLNVGAFENVATPFDFANILLILDELHSAVPTAALFTGVPMLLALDGVAGTELVRRQGDSLQGAWVLERKRCIREIILLTWRRLADRWGVESIVEIANKALNALPEPYEVPDPVAPPPGILPPPDQPTQFYPHPHIGESSAASRPALDPSLLVSEMASSPVVADKTGLDEAVLRKRLGAKWTVDWALNQSVERWASPSSPRMSGEHPHLDVAAVLMSMSNPSYQSFNRPASRAIDVSDLREALDHHSSPLNPQHQGAGGSASRPISRSHSFVSASAMSHDESPSIRTRTASPKRRVISTSSVAGGGGAAGAAHRSAGESSDVQEVLKDIFKSRGRKGPKGAANGPMGTEPAVMTESRSTMVAGAGNTTSATNGEVGHAQITNGGSTVPQISTTPVKSPSPLNTVSTARHMLAS